MNRTYKIIASRGAEILFDDRLQAVTPRQARSRLKEMLGLRSLSGVVYSITEIPVDLIRGSVDARVADLAGGDFPVVLVEASHRPACARTVAHRTKKKIFVLFQRFL